MTTSANVLTVAIATYVRTFIKCPVDVPRNTTVELPMDVATTAVNRTLFLVKTAVSNTGSSPPNGVLTNQPQKSSSIVAHFCDNNRHAALVHGYS